MPPGPTLVPAKRYYSPDFHEREMEQLWKHVWQMACHEDDLPGVGDYVPYEIGELSFLIVRSAPDEFKAFRNACLHRGRRLKERPGKQVHEIRCPFHSWAWKPRRLPQGDPLPVGLPLHRPRRAGPARGARRALGTLHLHQPRPQRRALRGVPRRLPLQLRAAPLREAPQGRRGTQDPALQLEGRPRTPSPNRGMSSRPTRRSSGVSATATPSSTPSRTTRASTTPPAPQAPTSRASSGRPCRPPPTASPASVTPSPAPSTSAAPTATSTSRCRTAPTASSRRRPSGSKASSATPTSTSASGWAGPQVSENLRMPPPNEPEPGANGASPSENGTTPDGSELYAQIEGQCAPGPHATPDARRARARHRHHPRQGRRRHARGDAPHPRRRRRPGSATRS